MKIKNVFKYIVAPIAVILLLMQIIPFSYEDKEFKVNQKELHNIFVEMRNNCNRTDCPYCHPYTYRIRERIRKIERNFDSSRDFVE